MARGKLLRMARTDLTGVERTYAEYLADEEKSDVKHEYLDGIVYAMSGGTPEHGALAMSLARLVGNALQGQPCRVFSSDVRVRVVDTSLSTYPDLTIACGKLEVAADDKHAITNPRVLFEVLSPSTEAYDRGAKFAHYRRIPSLAAYVLIAQDEPRIEVYFRNADGDWVLHEARRGERIKINTLDISLSVDEVYANPLAETPA